MVHYKNIIIVFFLALVCVFPKHACAGTSANTKKLQYVQRLFSIRKNISTQDENLPDLIKKTTGSDVRTLERLYELNTSTLTTIEAYFRILMIALSNDEKLNQETVGILNEWLSFMKNQCTYDKQYLEATLKETNNADVVSQVTMTDKITKDLIETTDIAVAENTSLISK